jgi:aldose sugar dehydrogenase
MTTTRFLRPVLGLLATASLLIIGGVGSQTEAQSTGPVMLSPRLGVRPVATGLTQPTSMTFLGANEMLVGEKASGQVKRVVNGAVQGTPVLDLAVNSGSERGLLGMALHPDFPANPGVYLYWTESTTGADTTVLSETPLLGNRVDRYVWNGSTLAFDRNLIRLRAIQEDAGQPPRGNHDGGVLAFGADGKLLVFVGDLGRRGQLQNLPCGPTPTCPPTVPDDQFGGPAPDNAHLSGVVLRLNDDGTTPSDNPFFAAGAATGGEVGANIQRIFSYGHRNSFGMAVDPRSGGVWLQENGDDTFSELNLVEPGMNGGWIQIAGPVERVAQFKEIETTFGGQNLQQLRWPPSNIANTPGEALSRLFMLPGAQYSDPELSWKWEVAPGGIGFLDGNGLGAQFRDHLFMGAATPNLAGGYLFAFELRPNRAEIRITDARLRDGVADNVAKHDITESERLLVGENFGVVTDIETGPSGNLYVLSLSQGAIYEVFRQR